MIFTLLSCQSKEEFQDIFRTSLSESTRNTIKRSTTAVYSLRSPLAYLDTGKQQYPRSRFPQYLCKIERIILDEKDPSRFDLSKIFV